VVDDPEAPHYQDFVIFMAEIGHRTSGKVPTYILNGKGIPGGEHALEGIFKEKGIAGVAEQFNKTVLTYKASIGQPIRIHIINIGDLIHTFHLHGMSLVSQQYFPGRVWPANVVQLLPGAAETIIVTPQYAGIWLFHCHVVSHADAGMIGLLIVE
jgi:FtsP/CotA-like multicopper oxidase with cupredoxin domain